MEIQELKKKGTSAVFWNFAGTLLKQGVGFVVSIFLARLLSPSDFGLVGMATVFIALTQSFSDFGMTSGLIQRKNPTEAQFSTVFYINIGVSFVLMLVMITCSDIIAGYYSIPEVGSVAKVVSVNLLINALNGVQNAQLTKALANKVKTLAAFFSAVTAGLLGIGLALAGFGVWSLVYSSILGSLVNTCYIWYNSSWRPKWIFNLQEVKPLLNYGSKMFASGFLDTLYNRLDILIIGRLFSPSTLGFYYRAVSFNQLVIRYTSTSLQGVFFPVISHLQHDKNSQVEVIKKSLHVICYLTFFLLGLLYLNANELIILLFSQKWLASVEFFKIMVFYGYAYPVSVVLVGVISGNGRSDKFLQLEVWKKIFGFASMAIGFYFGMIGFLWGNVISAFISVLLNMWYVQKIIDWKVEEQLYTLFPYLMLCIIPTIFLLNFLYLGAFGLFFSLIAKSILFTFIYVGINFLVKTEGQKYLNFLFGKIKSEMVLKLNLKA